MGNRILHILNDEKFIDGAIDIFNSTSSINTYVSIEDVKPFKYIKSHASDVQIVERENILSFIVDGGFDLVAFHTLTHDKYDLVLSIPKYIKVLWLSWGYDIYTSHWLIPSLLPIDLYRKKTREYIKSKEEKVSLIKKIKRLIKKVVFYKKHKQLRVELQQAKQKELDQRNNLLKRVDYISTVLPIEYDLLCRLHDCRAEYFPFQYSSDDYVHTSWIDDKANKIIIGNSATPTNNHLDVIKILRKRKITNECIIPCSYGDCNYLQDIKLLIKNKENLNFVDTFMPIKEYSAMLRSCKVGIFGHMRQQAIGNILICMLQGSKVFLYSDSIAYKYFKKAGYVVYTIEQDLTKKNVEKAMTIEEREINKNLITKQFGVSQVIVRLENKINEITIKLINNL